MGFSVFRFHATFARLDGIIYQREERDERGFLARTERLENIDGLAHLNRYMKWERGGVKYV